MKLKVGLAAIFLSLSVLLLQSYSFSTAKIKSDVTLNVASEHDALISITNWEGRIFTVVNNTASTVNIDSMTIMGDESLGVDGYFYSMVAGEARVFSLIGEAPKLSGKQLQLIASWDGGRAEITSWIPLIVEKVNVLTVNACTDKTDAVNKEVDMDTAEVETNEETDIDGVVIEGNEEADITAVIVEANEELDEIVVESNETDMNAVVVEIYEEESDIVVAEVELNEATDIDAIEVESKEESVIGEVVVESNEAAEMDELVVEAKEKTTEISTVVVAVDGGCLEKSEEVDEKVVEELVEEVEEAGNDAEEVVQVDEEEGTEEVEETEGIEETVQPEASEEAEKPEVVEEDVEVAIEESLDEGIDQPEVNIDETEETGTEDTETDE